MCTKKKVTEMKQKKENKGTRFQYKISFQSLYMIGKGPPGIYMKTVLSQNTVPRLRSLLKNLAFHSSHRHQIPANNALLCNTLLLLTFPILADGQKQKPPNMQQNLFQRFQATPVYKQITIISKHRKHVTQTRDVDLCDLQAYKLLG